MFVIPLTLSAIVHHSIIPDNYPEVFINSDMDPSGSLGITKTCPGIDGEAIESQTGKFGQKTGLLSLVGDMH